MRGSKAYLLILPIFLFALVGHAQDSDQNRSGCPTWVMTTIDLIDPSHAPASAETTPVKLPPSRTKTGTAPPSGPNAPKNISSNFAQHSGQSSSFAQKYEETKTRLYDWVGRTISNKKASNFALTTETNFEKCEFKNRALHYAVCKDGTKSYDQPDTENASQGLCGPTAASNVASTYCKNVKLSPTSGFCPVDSIGTKPETFVKSLNLFFKNYRESCSKDVWTYSCTDERLGYLRKLRTVTNSKSCGLTRIDFRKKRVASCPVPALTFPDPPLGAHYVTVVGIEGYPSDNDQVYKADTAYDKCNVVVNTWARQYKVNCLKFLNMSAFLGLKTYMLFNRNPLK